MTTQRATPMTLEELEDDEDRFGAMAMSRMLPLTSVPALGTVPQPNTATTGGVVRPMSARRRPSDGMKSIPENRPMNRPLSSKQILAKESSPGGLLHKGVGHDALSSTASRPSSSGSDSSVSSDRSSSRRSYAGSGSGSGGGAEPTRRGRPRCDSTDSESSVTRRTGAAAEGGGPREARRSHSSGGTSAERRQREDSLSLWGAEGPVQSARVTGTYHDCRCPPSSVLYPGAGSGHWMTTGGFPHCLTMVLKTPIRALQCAVTCYGAKRLVLTWPVVGDNSGKVHSRHADLGHAPHSVAEHTFDLGGAKLERLTLRVESAFVPFVAVYRVDTVGDAYIEPVTAEKQSAASFVAGMGSLAGLGGSAVKANALGNLM